MKYDFTNLVNDLKVFHIEVTDEMLLQFEQYYDLLVEWNSFMNLTAITEFEEVCKKHFVDSLSFMVANDQIKKLLSKEISEDEVSMIDVGTGAGFPGIPLKIVFPNLKITLLDSLNKRIKFLDTVITTLGLKNIETIHGRAEDIAKNKSYREQYDLCISRAVANMSTLSEYDLPFVKKDGLFIAFKSEKIDEELVSSKKAIELLGGKFVEKMDYYLPETDIYRNLVIVKKVKNTPGKFPRKAGLPSKEPLK